MLAAEAPPTDADPDQDPEGDTEGEGDAEGGSSSPSASPKRKSRKKAPKLDFLQAYGDLDTDVKDYSKQAFEAYKDGCRKIVEFMKFSDFVKTKKKFYRDLDIKYRQQKKKTKKENKEKTHEKYLQRLKEMPAEQFAKLDGKWLSNYGFDGKFSAEELAAGGCPVPEALPVYAVYQAALFHGVAPLGIVSEKTKKNAAGKPRQLFPVEGDDQPENEPNPIPKLRFYVGPALPYVYKTMSEFAATNKDRVNDADDAEDAAGSADADADGGEE